MRFKIKRIVIACIMAGIAALVAYRGDAIHMWLQRQMLQDDLMSQNEVARSEALNWLPQGKTVQELAWNSGGGWVPARVELEKWSVADRFFYRLRGPVGPQSPQAGEMHAAVSDVFCEVYFKTDFGHEVWRLTQDGGRSNWVGSQGIIATAQIPAAQYRISREKGYITLTFWTHQDHPVGNIVFWYQESDLEGWLAMDRRGPSRTDVRRWVWP